MIHELTQRIIKKKTLEIMLERLESHPKPSVSLEQYTTSVRVASTILFMAGYVYQDVVDKIVADFGCGTGILAIGAAIIGAKNVIAFEIDKLALKIARKNSKTLNVSNKINWILSDVEFIPFKKVDTVLMNPPFGVRREGRGRDLLFLKKAMEYSNTVYSLHLSGNKEFIENFVRENDGEVTTIVPMDMEIPPSFPFHKKKRHIIAVDCFRVVQRL